MPEELDQILNLLMKKRYEEAHSKIQQSQILSKELKLELMKLFSAVPKNDSSAIPILNALWY